MCAVFSEMGSKYVFQLEKSPDGFDHFQCLVKLHVKQRKASVLMNIATKCMMPMPNFQLAPSDAAFSVYCSKKETRVNGPWSKGMVGIQCKPPTLIEKEAFHPWQLELVETIEGPTDDRIIYWYYDPVGGAGKTQLCKYLVYHHNAFLFGGKAGDMASRIIMMESDVELAIMNIPRTHKDFVSYQTIEAIKDGLIMSGKYEGGQKLFDSPHVIVFANFLPDRTAMTEDRWKIKTLSTLPAPVFNLPEESNGGTY